MAVLVALLCTAYFGALDATLYSLLSSPRRTPRSWLVGTAGATALLVVLHASSGPLLGLTAPRPRPEDKFFFLWKFSGALVVLQLMSTWARADFARRRQRWTAAPAASSKALALFSFLADRAIYGLVFLYQLLAIWLPGMV